MKKQRGSAILIAVLLVAGIGSVAFSFGRILYLHIAGASAYESGVSAYYAAESGLEEGFLRYRYNRDSQLPTFSTASPNPSSGWFQNPNNVTRNNMSTLVLATISDQGLNKKNNIILDQTNQFYDLRMGWVSELQNWGVSYSSDSNMSTADPNYGKVDTSYYVARDSSKSIKFGDIFDGSNPTVFFLDLKPSNPITSPNGPSVLRKKQCVLVEAKITGKRLDGVTEEKKAMLASGNTVDCPYGSILSTTSDSVKTYSTNLFVGTTDYQLTSSLYDLVSPTAKYSDATLSLRPIGSDIAFRLRRSAADNKYLYSNSNTITSTGYFGGTTRTLEAKVDRQNGSLYDLYDYVLFQASN